MQHLDDRTQHTVHRLEAFSDVVMGFCLAQLGLSLVLPKSATDVVSVWASATFFVSAFITISVLWWLHHRTFTSFFVLNTPMVMLNFAMLCALVLTLYFLESIVRIAGLGQNFTVFFTLFVTAFAIVYGLLGVMLAVGLALRRKTLPAADVRWGVEHLVSISITVLFFILAASYGAFSGHYGAFIYVAMATAVAAGLVRRFALSRWLRKAVPDSPESA